MFDRIAESQVQLFINVRGAHDFNEAAVDLNHLPRILSGFDRSKR
jgi:hypothetical protein